MTDTDPIPGPRNHPATGLITPGRGDAVTDPCGCNQPDAVHQRGDQAFCRATLTALGHPI